MEKQVSPSSVCIVLLRKYVEQEIIQHSKFRIKLYFDLAAQEEFRRHLRKMQENLLFRSAYTNFAVSEGRNPRVKNAFLALSQIAKSPISKQRDEDNATLILSFAYMQERVQLRLYTFYSYMRQRGVFVSRLISAMVFGDTSYLMSATSLYAFLV